VYSSDELDIDQGNGGENNVHLKNWLEEGKEAARHCPPGARLPVRARGASGEVEQFLHYFCGDAANANA